MVSNMKIQFADLGRNENNLPRYCRKIMKQKDWPKTLEVYRGDMLCLTVDVEKLSKLKLNKDTLCYEKFDAGDVERLEALKNKGVYGSPVRLNEEVVDK